MLQRMIQIVLVLVVILNDTTSEYQKNRENKGYINLPEIGTSGATNGSLS